MVQKVRERIPTPESDNRLNNGNFNQNNPFSNIQTIASGVALTAQNLATNPSIFPSSNNVPILGTLLLSPINESDSVNNTLSSGSLAHHQTKSLLPFNVTSNAQFGSLVMNSSHDQDSTNSNSFVVIPTTMSDNEMIPVSITSVPLSITTTLNSTTSGAIITELPLDQPDSSNMRSAPATPRLGGTFCDSTENKVHRQQSLDSNRSMTTDDMSNASSNSNNTNMTSKRPGGKKHSEVYV